MIKLNFMNCIIIDDDPFSIKVIEKFIQNTDFLNLIQSYSSAVDAINFLNRNEEIHLIFLDIEMPEMTGLEFLSSLNNLPQVIIVSAKKNYAIDAFEYDVTDYVLKPVSTSRLIKAVDKAYSKYKERLMATKSTEGIFVKSGATYIRVNYEEIIWIEALENYVVLNTFSEKHTILFTMKGISRELPENSFVRIHRSFIININKISMIEDNTILVHTKNGIKVLPIAKSYKADLMKKINLVSK